MEWQILKQTPSQFVYFFIFYFLMEYCGAHLLEMEKNFSLKNNTFTLELYFFLRKNYSEHPIVYSFYTLPSLF